MGSVCSIDRNVPSSTGKRLDTHVALLAYRATAFPHTLGVLLAFAEITVQATISKYTTTW